MAFFSTCITLLEVDHYSTDLSTCIPPCFMLPYCLHHLDQTTILPKAASRLATTKSKVRTPVVAHVVMMWRIFGPSGGQCQVELPGVNQIFPVKQDVGSSYFCRPSFRCYPWPNMLLNQMILGRSLHTKSSPRSSDPSSRVSFSPLPILASME